MSTIDYVIPTPIKSIRCKGTRLTNDDYPDHGTRERVCAWVLENARSKLTFGEENCAERYLNGSCSNHVLSTVATLCNQFDSQAR